MSDLQRSFVRAKLAQLPRDIMPEGEDEADTLSTLPAESEYSDSSSASSASSTGTIKPLPSQKLFSKPTGIVQGGPILDEIPWTDFFSQELYLPFRDQDLEITYHAYLSSPTKSGPLFVMHHGAGSSGLSFAVCSAEIRKALPEAGILSIDARGHGDTVITSSLSEVNNSVDMSLKTLSQDLVNAINLVKEKMCWSKLPGLVLVGHSLGGAVVTEVAKGGSLRNDLLAYAVLDVVEGSAMDALQSMQTYLSSRPASFPTIQRGIEWHIRTRTIRNTTSAKVSVPSLLRRNSSGAWTWRTNLAATQPFWEGWFIGLSNKFLTAKGGKLLLLAGTDRLDKDLMIGQMQGKYQLQVFPEAGHFIQEDLPQKTAGVLVDFYRRNDRSALVLPPKVSDLLKNGQEAGAWIK